MSIVHDTVNYVETTLTLIICDIVRKVLGKCFLWPVSNQIVLGGALPSTAQTMLSVIMFEWNLQAPSTFFKTGRGKLIYLTNIILGSVSLFISLEKNRPPIHIVRLPGFFNIWSARKTSQSFTGTLKFCLATRKMYLTIDQIKFKNLNQVIRQCYKYFSTT